MKFLLVLFFVGSMDGGVSSQKIAVYDTQVECEDSGKSFMKSYKDLTLSNDWLSFDRVRYTCGPVSDKIVGN